MVGARVAKSIWSSRQSLPTHSGAVPAVDTIRCTLTDTSSLMYTFVILELNKQRWRCSNCHSTCTATTPVVSTNYAIGHGLATHMLKLASKSLPAKTIASLTGISTNSVQRILTANIHPHASRRLPINLFERPFLSYPNSSLCVPMLAKKTVLSVGTYTNK